MSADFRNRRLRLSVATALVSKVTGALAQLAVTPLVLAALGESRFGVFVAVTALGQWVALMGFGVFPALTRELAGARGNVALERQLVGAGFWVSVFLALLALAGGVALLLLVGSSGLVGRTAAIGSRELNTALAASLAIMTVQVLGALSQALRAGFQEMHITSVLTTIANLTVVAAVAGTRWFPVEVAGFVVIVQAPLAIVLLADLARILLSRRYLLPLILPPLRVVRHGELSGLSATSGTAWLIQLHDFAVFQMSVVLVSLWFGTVATASFGAAMRAVLLANSALGLMVFPMVPAMADAWARGDREWARKNAQRLVFVAVSVAVVFGVGFAIAGDTMMHAWLGHGLAWSRATCVGFGVFFFAFSLDFVGYNVLLALGATRGLGRIFIAEALAAATLALVLRPALGASAIPVALGVATAGISLGPVSWRLYQVLAPQPANKVGDGALI